MNRRLALYYFLWGTATGALLALLAVPFDLWNASVVGAYYITIYILQQKFLATGRLFP